MFRKLDFINLFFRFFLFLFHSIPRIHTPIARIPTLISRIHTPIPRIPILISLMPTLIPRISILIPRIHTLILGISRFPTPIPRIPTLIPRIPTLIPRTPTLIPRVPIIPLIPFPDSPFRLLQIALLLTCYLAFYRKDIKSVIKRPRNGYENYCSNPLKKNIYEY